MRKGMSLGDLPSLAIVMVVGFVVLGFGVKIIGDIGTGLTGDPVKVTGNATVGLLNLAQYGPLIGTVIAGAFIIGLLVNSFAR